tara:strand:- start:678 stop:1364 length:687 start_codon:yes stop_codon:yes gene_type:complete
MLKNNLGVVLFFGKENCQYSKKIKEILKKKSKKIYYFESKKRAEKIDRKYFKINYDYIFCFRSYYILKKNLLKKVKIAAINFHPGTPEYRGTGCVNYAIYRNSKIYGCTAHLINEKTDNGKIINVKKFKIDKKDNVERLLKKTHKKMFNQAFFIINGINRKKNNLDKWIKKNKKIKWSKKIKKLRDLNKFYEIKKNIKKKIFLNKIRATYTSKFKPYIILHGRKFILE